MDITQQELRRVLDYCPETGVFKWKERKQGRGLVAGNKHPSGYISITIDYKRYQAHNLAWLYTYGRWPESMLDHINRNPSDNRIENLREATNAENQQNKGISRNNTSGYIGVTWDKVSKKWQAQIGAKGQYKNLGRYETPEEAHKAYVAAKAQLHTFNPVLRDADISVDSLPDSQPISERSKYMPANYPYVTSHRYKDTLYHYAQVRFQGKTYQVAGFASEEEAHAAALGIKAKLESGEMTPSDLKAKRAITVGGLTMTKKEWAKYLGVDVSALYKEAKRTSFEEAVWRRLPLHLRGQAA